MNRTALDEEIEDIIDDILDIKEKISMEEMELESKKDTLLNLMTKSNKYEFNGEKGSAKIISYVREGLIKDTVLNTFNKVNKGTLDGKINVVEHIKKSPVCFVLVKDKF